MQVQSEGVWQQYKVKVCSCRYKVKVCACGYKVKVCGCRYKVKVCACRYKVKVCGCRYKVKVCTHVRHQSGSKICNHVHAVNITCVTIPQ